jgi:hypothetical protein
MYCLECASNPRRSRPPGSPALFGHPRALKALGPLTHVKLTRLGSGRISAVVPLHRAGPVQPPGRVAAGPQPNRRRERGRVTHRGPRSASFRLAIRRRPLSPLPARACSSSRSPRSASSQCRARPAPMSPLPARARSSSRSPCSASSRASNCAASVSPMSAGWRSPGWPGQGRRERSAGRPRTRRHACRWPGLMAHAPYRHQAL